LFQGEIINSKTGKIICPQSKTLSASYQREIKERQKREVACVWVYVSLLFEVIYNYSCMGEEWFIMLIIFLQLEMMKDICCCARTRNWCAIVMS
jgi:hypothetical protein